MKKIILSAVSIIFSLMLMAEEKEKNAIKPDKIINYKHVKTEKGEFDLKLHIFNPEQKGDKKLPCIVMIHGGGWNNGSPTSYYRSGKKWADMGMVAIAVEYRIRNKHGGTPLDSVRDAKSALRWIRSHADELGIDPDKIVATGGSAGGHLAAACAILPSLNEKGEDTSVSCKPNALILISPVFDNSPKGYGQYHKAIKEHWKEFSPLHNISEKIPPTIIFVGDKEPKHLPVETAKKFQDKAKEKGSQCEVFVLKGATHYKKTKEHGILIRREQEKFLKSLGFIK